MTPPSLPADLLLNGALTLPLPLAKAKLTVSYRRHAIYCTVLDNRQPNPDPAHIGRRNSYCTALLITEVRANSSQTV
jgi:hypothetical protein